MPIIRFLKPRLDYCAAGFLTAATLASALATVWHFG